MMTSQKAPKLDKFTNPIWNGNFPVSYLNNENGKFQKHFTEDLKSKSNLERVDVVWKSTFVDQYFESLCKNTEEDSHYVKSKATSTTLRTEANEFYKLRNFRQALRGYNLAICFAPYEEGDELVLAYANRAACLLELNQVESALHDVQTALTIGRSLEGRVVFNDALKTKLLEREQKCLSRLPVSKEKVCKDVKAETFFNLDSRSEFIDAAAEFVTISDDSIRGRHVRVTKEVEPGTVIILESPYAKVLCGQNKWGIDRCHFCMKLLRNQGLPCRHCAFSMFCSDSCIQSANATFHKYECVLSPQLYKMGLPRIVLLSLRIVLTCGSRSLYKYWKLTTEHQHETTSILGFDDNGKYVSSNYHTINSLIYHEANLSEDELRKYSLDSVLMTRLLQKFTDFFSIVEYDYEEENAKFKSFVASILLLHQMNLPCNAHSLNHMKLSSNPTEDDIRTSSPEQFGSGAFALLSLINHSCDPNVFRVTLANGVNAVISLRTIKNDEEVLDNYGAHYALDDKSSRLKHLQANYGFTCKCFPCNTQWPTMELIPDLEYKFLCQSCTSQLSFQVHTSKNFIKCVLDDTGRCNSCMEKFLITQRMSDLHKCIEKFQDTYTKVISNAPYESIPVLVQCLLCFDYMLPPFLYTNYAQETLKQAFNLINMHNLST